MSVEWFLHRIHVALRECRGQLSGLFVITLPLVDVTIVIIMTIIIIIFFISLFIFMIILLVDLRWQRYGKMMTLEKDFP